MLLRIALLALEITTSAMPAVVHVRSVVLVAPGAIVPLYFCFFFKLVRGLSRGEMEGLVEKLLCNLKSYICLHPVS